MSGNRDVVNGVMGSQSSRAGMRLATPLGFGVTTEVFGDMRRFFGGSWFFTEYDDVGSGKPLPIETQSQLREKAILWASRLAAFEPVVVREVMADFRDVNFKAPSLADFVAACELKQKAARSVNRSKDNPLRLAALKEAGLR